VGGLLRVNDTNYSILAKNNVRVLVPTIVNVGLSLVVMSGFGQNLVCSEVKQFTNKNNKTCYHVSPRGWTHTAEE
jgi:hypothetical protein